MRLEQYPALYLWSLIGSLVLALSACATLPLRDGAGAGAPGGGSGASDLPEPCTLLTAAEVVTALGAPVKEPVSEHELTDAECSYEVRSARSDKSVLVELTAVVPGNAPFEKRAHFFQAEGAHPVDGIGDGAYARQGTILTHKPGVILFLIVTDPTRDEPTVFDAARSLAIKVLKRLP